MEEAVRPLLPFSFPRRGRASDRRGASPVLHGLDYLREINTASVLLRLTLAMFCGGMIGLERARKHRPAGFRTYMLVCMGAALTMLLSQYENHMLHSVWAPIASEIGIRTDVSRFGAQVINGIGFLGTGTILITEQREVKGLTTAAGLWGTAGIGLAIGAGFYGLGIFSTALMLALQILMHRFMVRADALVSGQLLFTVRAGEGFPEAFRTFARGRDIQATDSKITYHDDGFVTYEMFVRLPRTLALSEVDKFLKTCGDVRCIGFTAAM